MSFESWTWSLEGFHCKTSADGLLHLVRTDPIETQAIIAIEVERIEDFDTELRRYAEQVWPTAGPARALGNLLREHFWELLPEDKPVVRMRLDRHGLHPSE